MPKTSYFYHRAALCIPDKYAELRERVRAAFNEAKGRYGYRRIHVVLTRPPCRLAAPRRMKMSLSRNLHCGWRGDRS